VRHPLDPAARRHVEISVEHAALRAELELEPGPFAHLQRGIAEMPHKVGGGGADQAGRNPRRVGGGHRLGSGLLGRSRASGDEQGESGDEAAHWTTMHAQASRGKVAGG